MGIRTKLSSIEFTTLIVKKPLAKTPGHIKRKLSVWTVFRWELPTKVTPRPHVNRWLCHRYRADVQRGEVAVACVERVMKLRSCALWKLVSRRMAP